MLHMHAATLRAELTAFAAEQGYEL